MKLIFLYGPPASGKLTIARELAKRTGYKLLHNHQTFDMLEPLFGDLHPEFKPLLNRIRLDIIATAFRSGIEGLIVTHVFGPEETDFIYAINDAVTESGGEAHFVRLVTHPEELERRVEHASRREFKKVRTPEELRVLMANWDVTQAVPGLDSITIDNTNLTPDQVADHLVRDLELPEQFTF